MSAQLVQLIVIGGVALAAAAVTMYVLEWFLANEATRKAISKVLKDKEKSGKNSLAAQKDRRRRQIQEKLREIEEQHQQAKRRWTLKMRIRAAGLQISTAQFYILMAASGLIAGFVMLVLTGNLYVTLGATFVGTFGLPFWLLYFLFSRRRQAFLRQLPDAIDALVRSLRAGLPLMEALKMIAEEMPEPLGPEFKQIVDAQNVGLPLHKGFEKLYERMPLPEVNFMSIAIGIQQKTGGNLAETLDNLSRVLRERHKMRQKVKAVSQEAKVSAIIVGILPIIICLIVTVYNPDYISLLWTTDLGNLLVVGAAVWMMIGAGVMWKMINFAD